MKNILTVILLLTFFVLSTSCSPSPDISLEDDISSKSNGGDNHGTLEELQGRGLNIIENQSFWVEFENWGRVRFVSGHMDIDGISKLNFFLADKEGRIKYIFPEYHGNENWCFLDLQAVSFKDINKDGLKDVIIVAEYMTGIGSQAATPFTVSGIYFNGVEFYSVPELNDEINSLGHNESIDQVVKFAEEKDLELDLPTQVYINVYYEPALWGTNTIILQGLSEGEFIEVVVVGEIMNFKHVGLVWNDDSEMLEEWDMINEFDKIMYQTIVIKTGIPGGIPQEKIKWQSTSGKDYEWIIQEDGVELQGWKFVLE